MDFKLNGNHASRELNVGRHLYSDCPLDEETQSIGRGSGLPWPPLDSEFPWQAMLGEAEAFVEARYPGQKGWMLLSLHGLGSQQVEGCPHYGFSSEEECGYGWATAGKACPVIRSYFTDVWPFGSYFRLRLAKQFPGGSIDPHCDYVDEHLGPVNFVLFQLARAGLELTGYGEVPYEPGRAFMLDLGKEHRAYNNATEDRVHIICRGVWAARMQDLVKRSYHRNMHP